MRLMRCSRVAASFSAQIQHFMLTIIASSKDERFDPAVICVKRDEKPCFAVQSGNRLHFDL